MLIDIRSALVEMYDEAGVFMPVIYENQTPSNPEKYVSFNFLPSDKSPITLGSNGLERRIGLLNLLIYVPINSGIGESLIEAQRIVDNFSPGKAKSSNSTTVKITKSQSEAGFASGDKYVTPITISWQSDQSR